MIPSGLASTSLPLEEAVFFFITNVLLTFGMTLLLANVSQERFTDIKNQIQTYLERRRRGRKKQNVNPQAR